MKKQKWCWIAREVKGGWVINLCIGKIDLKPHTRKVFKTIKHVENFANSVIESSGKIVFIHLKNSKFKTE